MARHSIVTRKDLRVGKSIWILVSGNSELPKKLTITKVEKASLGYIVYFEGAQNRGSVPSFRSSADAGTVGAYDERPAQWFTNKRAALFFHHHYGPGNPNFRARLANNQDAGPKTKRKSIYVPYYLSTIGVVVPDLG